MNTFDGTLESVDKCRKLAKTVLGEDWEKEYASKDVRQDGTLWAIGYCHIDTAWLWPWSATKKKVARSWSSQLDLMDRYPEFRFMATAAQHFQWLEQLYPKVFERVQEKVRSGQFGEHNIKAALTSRGQRCLLGRDGCQYPQWRVSLSTVPVRAEILRNALRKAVRCANSP